MMFIRKRNDSPSFAKIVFAAAAAVLGVLALAAVAYKLIQKYRDGAFWSCCEDDYYDDECDDFVEIECEDDELDAEIADEE